MVFDVFISYSTQDKTAADAACAALEAAGIRCWIAPRDIPPGTPWSASIVRAIDQCRAMVLVYSSHANGSAQVHREVDRAFSRGVPVVPLRIEDVEPADGLAYFLSSVHWLDALTPPIEEHLKKLAATIIALLITSNDLVSKRKAQGEAEQRAEDEEHRRKPQALVRQRGPWKLLATLSVVIMLIGAAVFAAISIPWGDSGGAQRAAEVEAKRKAEDEAKAKVAAEEKRKAEEAEQRRLAEEDAKRKAAEEEAKSRAEADAARRAAEDEAKRKVEDEAARQKAAHPQGVNFDEVKVRARAAQLGIPLPPKASVVAPSTKIPTTIVEYLGAWGGGPRWNGVGRQFLLIVTNVDESRIATGVYAQGPPNSITYNQSPAQFASFRGTISENGLQFVIFKDFKYTFVKTTSDSMTAEIVGPPNFSTWIASATIERVK
jgi:hypothetical protein